MSKARTIWLNEYNTDYPDRLGGVHHGSKQMAQSVANSDVVRQVEFREVMEGDVVFSAEQYEEMLHNLLYVHSKLYELLERDGIRY